MCVLFTFRSYASEIYIYIHNYIYFVRLDFRYAVTHKHHSSETENERFSAFSASIYPAPHCGGRPPESSGSSPLFHHSLRLHLTSESRMWSWEATRFHISKSYRYIKNQSIEPEWIRMDQNGWYDMLRYASRHQESMSSSCSLVNQEVAAATARSASPHWEQVAWINWWTMWTHGLGRNTKHSPDFRACLKWMTAWPAIFGPASRSLPRHATPVEC